MTAPLLAHRLAWLGSLPFLGCALIALGDLVWLNRFGGPLAVANLYALLILAFMAGTHWGQALGDTVTRGAWVFSNAVVLAGFFAALFLPSPMLALCHAVLFLALAMFDYRQWRAGHIDLRYWNTRWRVSAVVIGCLLGLALSA